MKNSKKILSLLLAVLITASFTACKKGDTASELSDEIEYIYQYESGEEPTGEDNSQTGQNNQEGGNSGTTSGTRPSTTDSSFEQKAKKYRGTKVVYATWRDPNVDEDGPVIKAFEKKYGIDVEIDMISQGTYHNTVASRIASNDAPDIYFVTSTFPTCLSNLQPISAAELDLSDPIWDTVMFEKSKINGKSYLVNTVGNIWNEVACVFYNKKIFRDNNITTPEEYQKAGKWNFDTFEKAMRDVKAADKEYVGSYIDFDALLCAGGGKYYNWSGGKFSNGVNTRLGDIAQRVATWKKDGLIRGIGVQDYTTYFKNGQCGMAVADAWGLKRTGYWRNMNFEDVGFTYLPSYKQGESYIAAGIYRAWGICKGAKNPAGAGVFLRYYLDVNNYDTGSAFITPAAEDFFFKLTANMKTKEYYMVDYGAGATARGKIFAAANGDPNQAKSSLSAITNTINSDVKSLNDFIAKQK